MVILNGYLFDINNQFFNIKSDENNPAFCCRISL